MEFWQTLGIIGIIIGIASGIVTIVSYFVSTSSTKQKLLFTGIPLAIILIVSGIASLANAKGLGQKTSGTSTTTTTVAAGTTVTASPSTLTPVTVVPTSPSTLTQPTTAPTLVPTSPPVNTILYQEDGSNNWSDWLISGPDWAVLNGKLINTDGNGNPPLIAPYSPGTNNINDYAVIVKITRIKYTSNTQGSFGIVVRDNGNGGGYTFSICAEDNYVFGTNSGCNSHDQYEAMLLLGKNFPDGSVLKEQPFKPAAGIEYTYRVEVKGGTITAFINGTPILGSVTDYTNLSGGQISIWDIGSQLSISSFEVIAL